MSDPTLLPGALFVALSITCGLLLSSILRRRQLRAPVFVSFLIAGLAAYVAAFLMARLLVGDSCSACDMDYVALKGVLSAPVVGVLLVLQWRKARRAG